MNSILGLLGRNIRSRRTARHLSQEQLAARSGLHRTYIGGVERGERNITVENLERIANALEVAPAELLARSSEPAPPAT